MKRIIITEEEKSRILGLYEGPTSINLAKDLATILGITENELSFLNSLSQENINNQSPKNLTTIETNITNELSKVLPLIYQKNNTPEKFKPIAEKLVSYKIDVYGKLNQNQKMILDGIVSPFEDFLRKSTPQQNPQQLQTKPSSSPNTKIGSIPGDKDYEYKLENGKYYLKGKEGRPSATKYPNWIEAKGKGLQSIKQKVKFQ